MADGMEPCKACGKMVSPNVAVCPDGRRTGECGLDWEPCKVCGKTVSPNAKTCPHCGKPGPVVINGKWWVVGILIIIFLIGKFLQYIFGPDGYLR